MEAAEVYISRSKTDLLETNDKRGQVTMGATAGTMVARPVGAAVGELMGNLMKGKVRGFVVECVCKK